MKSFVSALRSGDVLVMDGAMGTEILRLQATPLDCCERANLLARPLVGAIHHGYLDAGAEVLLTNTFQANPHALAKHGLADQFHAIWQAAFELARAPIGKPHAVLAAIGPVESLTDDLAHMLLAECSSADGVLLETWTLEADLACFYQARSETTTPLLVSFAFRRDAQNRLTTFAGQTPEECARSASKHQAIALGANCGRAIGMTEMVEIVRRYHDACDLPVFVRPNAGTPTDGISPQTPESMGEMLDRLFNEGIAMIGGCCGTTPDHIWRFRLAVDAWNTSRKR